MATVRLSRHLREYILSQIRSVYDKQITAEYRKFNHSSIAEACYHKYVDADTRTLAAKLNTRGKWLDETRSISVSISYLIDGCQEPTSSTFSVVCGPGFFLPRDRNTHFELTSEMEPYNAVRDIFIEVNSITNTRTALIDRISRLLNDCSTLQQVEKAWPTVLDFVPTTVREQFHLIEEKKTRVKPDLSIDNDIKASLITARLLNTQG